MKPTFPRNPIKAFPKMGAIVTGAVIQVTNVSETQQYADFTFKMRTAGGHVLARGRAWPNAENGIENPVCGRKYVMHARLTYALEKTTARNVYLFEMLSLSGVPDNLLPQPARVSGTALFKERTLPEGLKLDSKNLRSATPRKHHLCG